MAESLHKTNIGFTDFEVWQISDGAICIDIEYDHEGTNSYELTEGDEKALLKILQERENERKTLT